MWLIQQFSLMVQIASYLYLLFVCTNKSQVLKHNLIKGQQYLNRGKWKGFFNQDTISISSEIYKSIKTFQWLELLNYNYLSLRITSWIDLHYQQEFDGVLEFDLFKGAGHIGQWHEPYIGCEWKSFAQPLFKGIWQILLQNKKSFVHM